MPENIDYFENKLPDRIYVSKPFNKSFDPEEQDRRIISKVFDPEELHEFIKIKDVITLKVTPGKRQEIVAVFYEDDRKIDRITVQRFERKSGTPHKHSSFTFSISQLKKIYELLNSIPSLTLPSGEKVTFSEDALEIINVEKNKRVEILYEILDLLSDEEQIQLVKDKPRVLKAILENSITEFDVVALSYRKNQLDHFEKLLNNPSYFNSIKSEIGLHGDEAVWQDFFENNSWIFGYGLNYIFTSNLQGKKLEQVTSGSSFLGGGKRVDALMKTIGFISSLCFVEIKTHKTDLLTKKTAYRKDSWPISSELSGSISQIQKTVQKAIMNIREKAEPYDESGDPTGEKIFAYQPKSFVVIGSLDEFMGEHGIDQEKFSSFELFRRQLSNPEIITYDELYERARHIVEHSKNIDNINETSKKEPKSHSKDIDEDDIPF